MSLSYTGGRWAEWRTRCGQGSTDALANWAAKAGAKVEWETTPARLADNTAFHIATPILTCVKCHPLMDAYGTAINQPCSDQSQARLLCESVVRDWEHKYRGYYQLIWYEPHIGGYGSSYTVSITICYQLNQCLIRDCEGRGPNLRAAKSAAAEKLLKSGHCMICL
ncbi:unnamed protein product [Rhizoctonia solani]|uniref:Uncharacterized protein n=1 Tax=Rhizoctonia solani TaxID=456999 RepID=A0A8H3GR72_9AGAM|nr:unnamed protein product [Rhizoctonia solani]